MPEILTTKKNPSQFVMAEMHFGGVLFDIQTKEFSQLSFNGSWLRDEILPQKFMKSRIFLSQNALL